MDVECNTINQKLESIIIKINNININKLKNINDIELIMTKLNNMNTLIDKKISHINLLIEKLNEENNKEND